MLQTVPNVRTVFVVERDKVTTLLGTISDTLGLWSTIN